MSLKNIKLNQERGFTIVELLIVVVVIAILAAITIVSYNGITNRANQSSAKAVAANVQKKLELYQSEVGNYPISLSAMNDSSKSYGLASTTIGNVAPTASSPSSGTDTKGTGYVQVRACRNSTAALSASNITGIRIIYWSYGADGTSSTAPVTFATVGSDASCANIVDLGA